MTVFAGRGLMRRPVQTTLLLIALTVALAGTMTIMAVLSGINLQVYRDLQRVGLDVINVQMAPELGDLLGNPLIVEDTSWMKERSGGGRVAPFRSRMAVGANLRNQLTAEFLLLEITPLWGDIIPLESAAGRFLKPDDKHACVLDEWVANRFFPEGNAIGMDLFVSVDGQTVVLDVVGVLKDPFNIRKKFDEFDFAGSARSTMNRMLEFKSVYIIGDFAEQHDSIHGTVIQVPDQELAGNTVSNLQQELGKRGLPAIAWARRQWVDNMMRGTDLTTQIAGMLWVIVLMITGVMILTISLVAIRERYQELAVRRTEGARAWQIVGQLLVENLILSFAAGLLAIGLAHVIGNFMAARYLSWSPAFIWHEMALALGLGVGIGALATVLPAARAASLDPVQVLRNT